MMGGQNNYKWVGVSHHRLGGAAARENTAPRAVPAGGAGCHCWLVQQCEVVGSVLIV